MSSKENINTTGDYSPGYVHGNATYNIHNEPQREGYNQRGKFTFNHVRDYVSKIKSSHYVKRNEILTKLNQWVLSDKSNVILSANAGYGKSTILAHWIDELLYEKEIIVTYHFFSQTQESDVFKKYKDCLRSLIVQICSGIQRPSTTYQIANPIIGLHNLLSDIAREMDKLPKIIIILDAVDESDRNPPLSFLNNFSEFVVIVASCRTNELRVFHDVSNFRLLEFDRLSKEQVLTLLETNDNSKVRNISAHNSNLQILESKARGYPLYLTFIIDDIKSQKSNRVETIETVLNQTPKSFKEYIRKEFSMIARSRSLRKEDINLFRLLAISRAPLNKDIVFQVTGLDEFLIESIPNQVKRWINISESYFFSFIHPYLAEEFRAITTHKTNQTQNLLIDYCNNDVQSNNPNDYTLRYLVDHMLDAGLYEKSINLLLYTNFTKKQSKTAYYNDISIQNIKSVISKCKSIPQLSALITLLGLKLENLSTLSLIDSLDLSQDKIPKALQNIEEDKKFILTLCQVNFLIIKNKIDWAESLLSDLILNFHSTILLNKKYVKIIFLLLLRIAIMFEEVYELIVKKIFKIDQLLDLCKFYLDYCSTDDILLFYTKISKIIELKDRHLLDDFKRELSLKLLKENKLEEAIKIIKTIENVTTKNSMLFSAAFYLSRTGFKNSAKKILSESNFRTSFSEDALIAYFNTDQIDKVNDFISFLRSREKDQIDNLERILILKTLILYSIKMGYSIEDDFLKLNVVIENLNVLKNDSVLTDYFIFINN